MSKNSKYDEEKFSLRSLESIYLPHMFSENEAAIAESKNEDSVSVGSISSTQSKIGNNRAITSFTELQSTTSYHHRFETYDIAKEGRQISYTV